MTPLYDLIAANRRRSVLLVAGFVALLAGLGWVFGETRGAGWAGVVFAVFVATVSALTTYFAGDRMVLAVSRARPASKQEFPYLYNTVEALAIGAGLPMPALYVIDDTAPNAFATGRDPAHASVAVTTGILQKLDRAELEGVLGHEMSHVRNFDIRLTMLVAVLVGTTALLSDWMLRSMGWGRRARSRGRSGGGAMAILLLLSVVLAILAPFIAQLIQFAVSREREYLADASGALLTRNPDALASALEKISADTEPLEVANKATAHLYVVNPLLEHGSRLNNLFSTHPPIVERIARLRGMRVEEIEAARADLRLPASKAS